MTEAELAELERLTAPPTPLEVLDGLPLSVKIAILDAARAWRTRAASSAGDVPLAGLELAPELKVQLQDAFRCGWWRGPPDPPKPWELPPKPAAAPEVAQLPEPLKAVPAPPELAPVVRPRQQPSQDAGLARPLPLPTHSTAASTFSIPERLWKPFGR